MEPSESDDRENGLTENLMTEVSIKGLSDRAVAELNVQSRTSLFGSILRLFDMPRNEELTGNISEGDKKNGICDEGAGNGATTEVAVVATVAPEEGEASTDPMIMKEPILSTAEIVRTVHLTARPGDIPAGMDSKEYSTAALHFLSSYIPYIHEDEIDYREKEDGSSQEGWDQLRNTLPILPLIKATNPGASLEQRCYGRVKPLIKLGHKARKQSPDSIDQDEEFRRKVLNLELIFASSLPYSSQYMLERLSSVLDSGPTRPASLSMESAAATNPIKSTTQQQSFGNDLPFAFQRYVPRRKLVPVIEGGAKEELTLMISGHMQQPENTSGPKTKVDSSKTESTATTTAGNKKTVHKEKGVADPHMTPSKRKGNAPADSLYPSKKEK